MTNYQWYIRQVRLLMRLDIAARKFDRFRYEQLYFLWCSVMVRQQKG
jgi:hypothetical protein